MDNSTRWFSRARRLMPGGVNSPVRAFRAVGGTPRFIARAQGAFVWDVDGRRYVDYVGSWGPMILGHAHPAVVAAIRAAAARGTSYGAPTPGEVEMAAEIRRAFPSIEKLRLVSSGTEACMSALRVARGFTGRDEIIKFEGCYHGHSDGLLVKAGSGAATFGHPSSAGVPAPIARLTHVLPYNDAEAAKSFLRRRGRRVAAVIVEPIAGNMGVVRPVPGFLETLRRETRQAGALLIFDEVISGFRVRYGSAADVVPDLTTLGKIIGGGLPVGAYGGRREIMERVAPEGPVYQAGTLSGNPLAVAAGLATLRALRRDRSLYRRLDERAAAIAAAFRGVWIERAGSLLTAYFQRGPVRNWADADRSDRAAFGPFFHAMLDRGFLLPPSQFEAWFVSAAHKEADVERTVRAIRESLPR